MILAYISILKANEEINEYYSNQSDDLQEENQKANLPAETAPETITGYAVHRAKIDAECIEWFEVSAVGSKSFLMFEQSFTYFFFKLSYLKFFDVYGRVRFGLMEEEDIAFYFDDSFPVAHFLKRRMYACWFGLMSLSDSLGCPQRASAFLLCERVDMAQRILSSEVVTGKVS